ncbi:MAG TPA: hypothetical protein VFE24_09620 [Pirellulales bacterium]|jgi:hypothetical protein|nr:hypothetical protein [Pirellulales bacterium]
MRDVFARYFLLLGLGLAGVAMCTAAGPAPAPAAPVGDSSRAKTATASTPEHIAALVKELGSDQCRAREAATTQLMEIGIATRGPLLAALDHPDLEVRIRARRVLATVTAEDLQRRLKAFADDESDNKGLSLPGWAAYKKEFGGTGQARKLFVEMEQAEPSLLAVSELGPRQTAEALNERFNAIQSELMGQQFRTVRQQTSLGSTLALFYLSSNPDVKVSEQTATGICRLPYQSALHQVLLADPGDGIPKKILGKWILQPTTGKIDAVVQQNLSLAIQFKMPEGIHPALKVLQSTTLPPYLKQQALLVVGKYGNKEHLPIVAPLLEDKAQCGNLFWNQRMPVRFRWPEMTYVVAPFLIQSRAFDISYLAPPPVIQLRDIALAVAIHLHGQEPKDFGYEHIQPNDQLLYQLQTVGFEDEGRRDAAFQKWHDWQTAQSTPKK